MIRLDIGVPDNLSRLLQLLNAWREPGPMVRVQSKMVVPDATNREYTLLSVEHVHYIAHRMRAEGFRARVSGTGQGHDVPVLVRGSSGDALAADALANWRKRSTVHGFPRCDIPEDGDTPFFLSLGNGHFNQALNLFRLGCPSILGAYNSDPFTIPPGPNPLRTAIETGVPSVVLRPDIPLNVRKELSLLLNQTHLHKWDARESTGECYAIPPVTGVDIKPTMFEALSKVSDAEMLGQLVREKLDKTPIPVAFPQSKL
jgi:hypothetical protein